MARQGDLGKARFAFGERKDRKIHIKKEVHLALLEKARAFQQEGASTSNSWNSARAEIYLDEIVRLREKVETLERSLLKQMKIG